MSFSAGSLGSLWSVARVTSEIHNHPHLVGGERHSQQGLMLLPAAIRIESYVYHPCSNLFIHLQAVPSFMKTEGEREHLTGCRSGKQSSSCLVEANTLMGDTDIYKVIT